MKLPFLTVLFTFGITSATFAQSSAYQRQMEQQQEQLRQARVEAQQMAEARERQAAANQEALRQMQEANRQRAAEQAEMASRNAQRQAEANARSAAGAADVAASIRGLGDAIQEGNRRNAEDQMNDERRRDLRAEQRRAEYQETMEQMTPAEPAPRSAESEEPVARTRVSGGAGSSSSARLPGERFPQTHTGYISDADAAEMSYSKLRYAINEIYARYGAPFENKPEIREVFSRFSWYHPQDGLRSDDIDDQMTEIEKANVVTLAKYRNASKP